MRQKGSATGQALLFMSAYGFMGPFVALTCSCKQTTWPLSIHSCRNHDVVVFGDVRGRTMAQELFGHTLMGLVCSVGMEELKDW